MRTTVTVLAAIAALTASASLAERLDSLVASRYSDDEPGAAIIVARGDSVLYERYVGIADMPSGAPVTAATRFNIASCSKQFTVVGLLRLAEQGLVDLDKPLAEYFPDYSRPFWQDITLRHLMNHSSGLPDSRQRSDRRATVFADDAYSMAYFPSVEALKFAPGAAYDYLNPSFLLLARVIEQKSGLPFTVYQQRYIFEPSGMFATYYFDPAACPGDVAHGYLNTLAEASDDTDGSPKVVTASGKWQEYDYGEETFFATRPDGGIYSCPRDLLKWERALRRCEIVGQEMRDLAYTPHITVYGSEWCDYQNRPNTSYGYGWFIDSTPGRPLKVYHTGDNGGFKAYMAKYPEEDVVVIVLENRCDLDRWSFGLAIEEALFQ